MQRDKFRNQLERAEALVKTLAATIEQHTNSGELDPCEHLAACDAVTKVNTCAESIHALHQRILTDGFVAQNCAKVVHVGGWLGLDNERLHRLAERAGTYEADEIHDDGVIVFPTREDCEDFYELGGVLTSMPQPSTDDDGNEVWTVTIQC